MSVSSVSTEASVCVHAKTNQQKPKCGKKHRLVFHRRRNEAWDSLLLAQRQRRPWCVDVLSCSNKNNTDLSFDEVELGVTLHTSRALEDEGRGKTGCYTTCWARWIRVQQQLEKWTGKYFFLFLNTVDFLQLIIFKCPEISKILTLQSQRNMDTRRQF